MSRDTKGNGLHAKEVEEKTHENVKIRYVQKCRACAGFEDKINPTAKNDEEFLSKLNGRVRDDLRKVLEQRLEERNEQYEDKKHDIIVQIADLLNDGPRGIAHAEKIFEELKYVIANYVIRYEFNEKVPLSTQLALWLDMKMEPRQEKRLERVINHFFHKK